MPDLTALIAAHRAARPTPISLRATLTSKGEAVVALHRFADLVGRLDGDDRAAVLSLFADQLRAHYADGRAG